MSSNSHTPYNNAHDGKYNFKKKMQKVYVNIIDGFDNDGVSSTDPLGMYTGIPEDPYDEPVQDADDL